MPNLHIVALHPNGQLIYGPPLPDAVAVSVAAQINQEEGDNTHVAATLEQIQAMEAGQAPRPTALSPGSYIDKVTSKR